MKEIMKRFGIVLLAICILMSVPMVFASGAASEDVNYTIDTPYQYPITPGTDEWNAILDHAERIELCQIPEDILPLMTTGALARTVIAYPFMVDMYAWDSTSIGYKVVALTFNGLQELERRPDGLSVLTMLLQESARTSDEFFSRSYINTIINEMSAGETSNISGGATATCVYTPNNSAVPAIEGLAWADHNLAESLKGFQPFILR